MLCFVYSLDCSILIQDDASISRKHSVITVQHDEANLVMTLLRVTCDCYND